MPAGWENEVRRRAGNRIMAPARNKLEAKWRRELAAVDGEWLPLGKAGLDGATGDVEQQGVEALLPVVLAVGPGLPQRGLARRPGPKLG